MLHSSTNHAEGLTIKEGVYLWANFLGTCKERKGTAIPARCAEKNKLSVIVRDRRAGTPAKSPTPHHLSRITASSLLHSRRPPKETDGTRLQPRKMRNTWTKESGACLGFAAGPAGLPRASTVVGGCGGCFYAATVVVVVAVAPAVWTTTPEGTVTPEGMDTPEGREMVMAETMPKELATARRVAKQAFIVAGDGVGGCFVW